MSDTRVTMYLHIGAGKTGSSSIQAWLKHYELPLAAAGYLIFDNQFQPTCQNQQNGFDLISSQNDYFVEISAYGGVGVAQFHEQFTSNLAYMHKHGFTSGIISAESLLNDWHKRHEYFIDIKHLCDWKIIVYVRNQPFFLASAWKEWGYLVADFPIWIEKLALESANWMRHIDSWEQLFGIDAVYLGVLEKHCLVDGSLTADFNVAIGSPLAEHNDDVLLLDNASISNRTALALSYLRRVYNADADQPVHLHWNSARHQQYDNSEWKQYQTRMSQLFRLKGTLQHHARQISMLRNEQSIDLFDAQMLKNVNDYYYELNRQLLAKYRPDLDANVAFPPVMASNHLVMADSECEVHATIMALVSIDSLTHEQQEIHKHIAWLNEKITLLHEENTKLQHAVYSSVIRKIINELLFWKR